MARIPTGLCWSRHLTDSLQPYKACQGSGGGAQMHLSIEGRKQEEGGPQRGDTFQWNTVFIYLPKSFGQLITSPGCPFQTHSTHRVSAAELFPSSQTLILTSITYISSIGRRDEWIPFARSGNRVRQRPRQSTTVTTVLNQSQMDTQLSSPRAKSEAYWAELQRAHESLWEDSPAGLEPSPLGTERSVVSSMPPNEMHRVIWLTICILLQATAEHVMEMPDQIWKCHVHPSSLHTKTGRACAPASALMARK